VTPQGSNWHFLLDNTGIAPQGSYCHFLFPVRQLNRGTSVSGTQCFLSLTQLQIHLLTGTPCGRALRSVTGLNKHYAVRDDDDDNDDNDYCDKHCVTFVSLLY
jgi:hypothetical protein